MSAFAYTKIAQDVERMTLDGRICSECSAEFTEAHGKRVACDYCKRHGSDLPKATHPEVSREAHKTLARKRRKEKKA